MAVKRAPDVDAFLERLAVQARAEQALARRLRREGATLSEYRVLRLLAQSETQELRLLDLTEALGLDQSSVSRLVVRLEQSGAVRREPCGDDRRGVYCVLTDRGAERERHLTPAFADALGSLPPGHGTSAPPSA
jgi:DNA-binding MarR family transcriptional regulator